MQQACKPVGGESRRGGERPRGRNETSQVAARRRRESSHSTTLSGVDTGRSDDGEAHRGCRQPARPRSRCAVAQSKPMSGGSVGGQSTQTTSKTSKVRVKSVEGMVGGSSELTTRMERRSSQVTPATEQGHGGSAGKAHDLQPNHLHQSVAGSGQHLVVSSRDAQHHGWRVGQAPVALRNR
jgi:hypothetical protein